MHFEYLYIFTQPLHNLVLMILEKAWIHLFSFPARSK